MTEKKTTKLTERPIFWVVFLTITVISGLIHFGVISEYSTEDNAVRMPVYMSGEPADITGVIKDIEQVEVAACSGSELGIKIVKEAVKSGLRLKADELGGDAVVDTSFSVGPHETINKNCPYPVSAIGMAVEIEN